MAVEINGWVCTPVGSFGHPVFSDDYIEIEYNGNISRYDVSRGSAFLHKLCPSEGKDFSFIVRTNEGEFIKNVSANIVSKTFIQWY